MLQPLPLGKQYFDDLREGGYLYVDKTELVYKLTHLDSDFVFLSRPRRFGKSLLVSTLKAYFEGRRELFKDLALEQLESAWTEFPVLHFDFSKVKDITRDMVERNMDRQLAAYEKIYGRDAEDMAINDRFSALISRTAERTGHKVVLLVDEYDAPLLEVLHDEEKFREVRTVMRNFYAPLKACSNNLRFVFLTGVTKFSQLSIFSEFNNINNVSMDEEFAAICGITEAEMLSQLAGHTAALAKKQNITLDEAIAALKEMYDGYHFTWPSPDIYNPYSLLTALSKGKIESYWFTTGTPSYLMELLRKFEVAPLDVGFRKCAEEEFNVPIERKMDLVPLLYQSGYITIKACSRSKVYTLDYPNREVNFGMTQSLLSNYVEEPNKIVSLTKMMNDCLLDGDMDGALKLMQATFATIPYCQGASTEGHYQAMMVLMFKLLGQSVEPEIRTAKGRIDLVLRHGKTVYLMELKINSTAQEALAQIDEKQYAAKFALEEVQIVKVGMTFDTAERTLGEWIIEPAP